MGRKILKVLSIIELFVGIAIYFILDWQYSLNPHILLISQLNTEEAKIYALFLYVVPAIHIIAGLLASIFNGSKKLMIFMGIILLASSLIHEYIIFTDISDILMISTIVLGTIYLFAAIIAKANKPLRR